ncbi:MAG: SpoIIE family protein phosphatase [Spirochaetes bacterium]|nr:SpoIIE family protein phosphatase [Spirochaetota bacterium]
MRDDRTIGEIAGEFGLPVETVRALMDAWEARRNDAARAAGGGLTEGTIPVGRELFDRVTAALSDVLNGRDPRLLEIPPHLAATEFGQMLEYFNRFMAEYLVMSEFAGSIARGELDFEPPRGRMAVLSGLKTLQSHLRHLTYKTQRIAQGDLAQQVDFIGDFSRAFNSMTSQLRDAFERIDAQRAELETKNRQLEEARRIAQHDMSLAVNVQLSLLPGDPPPDDAWDAAFYFRPMSGVSGDFYDFFRFDDRLCGAGVFDVSGHGIASSLVAMVAKWEIYRSFRKNLRNPLNEVPRKLSGNLVAAIGPTTYYITGVIVRFDGAAVEYVNAGHHDIFLKREGRVEPVRTGDGRIPRGLFLGIEDLVGEYEVHSFSALSGDLLCLYTDGLVESTGPSGEEFGDERLVAALRGAPGGSARSALDHLMESFFRFKGGLELGDDCTVMVLRKK